jgi:hypothetical protein
MRVIEAPSSMNGDGGSVLRPLRISPRRHDIPLRVIP